MRQPFRRLRVRNRTLMLRVTRYNHATLPSAVDRAEILMKHRRPPLGQATRKVVMNHHENEPWGFYTLAFNLSRSFYFSLVVN